MFGVIYFQEIREDEDYEEVDDLDQQLELYKGTRCQNKIE